MYFPKFRKIVDLPPAAPPPAGPGTPRRGRPAKPIPPAALDRIRTLRESGETFESIRGVLHAEHGLRLGLATLHKLWQERIEPATPDGQQIVRWQKLLGLPTARWRRILSGMRRRAASSTPTAAGVCAASPEDSET